MRHFVKYYSITIVLFLLLLCIIGGTCHAMELNKVVQITDNDMITCSIIKFKNTCLLRCDNHSSESMVQIDKENCE